MDKLGLPDNLLDKIFQIKTDKNENIVQLVSYFPLSEDEKYAVMTWMKEKFLKIEFKTIFSDSIDDHEWNKSKVQIKKRFNNELIDIDNF